MQDQQATYDADADYEPPAVVVDDEQDEATEQTPAAASERSLALLGRDQHIQRERTKLQTEYDTDRLNYQIIAAGKRDLERDLATARDAGKDDEVERLTVLHAKHETWEDALVARLARTKKDIDLIDSPSSVAALDQMLARRNAAGTSARVTDTVLDEPAFHGVIKASRGKTSETSWSVNGVAGTETSTTARTRDLASGTYGTSQTDKIEFTSGDDSASRTTTKTQKLGVGGFESSTEQREDETTGDIKSSTSTKRTDRIGLGGASSTQTDTTQAGDYQIKNEKSSKLTRGDGKLGASRSSSTTTGTVDADGNLTHGTTTTSEAGAFVKADKDGVGVGGNAALGRDNQHSENVKTGVKVACDGHVTVSVKKYEGSDAALKDRFVVVVALYLGAGVGGSGQLGKDSGTRGGIELGAKGSVAATFKHVMSADETNAYLADLGGVSAANAGNGKYPELAQISAAWRNGWSGDGASAVSNAAQITALDSPDALDKMAEGDEIEVTVAGSVDAKGTAGTSSGGMNAGVEGGVSRGGKIKIVHGKVKGQLAITILVEGDEGWSVAAKGGYGFSAKVGYGEKESAGRGATFYLPKTLDNYAAIKNEIEGARSAADVEALVAKYPSLLQASEKSESETEETTVGIDVGKVGFEMGGSGTVGTKTEIDKDGKQTQTDTGSSSSSGKVKVFDKTIGDSKTDAISTTVDADNKATGDLSTTESGTDFGKTALDIDDRINQSGWLPVVTGSALKPSDSTEQSGMLLSDADYDTIIAEAERPERWNKHWSSTRHEDDWKALRREIVRAKGDKKKVGAALARFQGDGDHGRAELLANVVRTPGTGSGGTLYDFPDGLGNLKSDYKSLVFDDPATAARALAKQGKTTEAAAEAKAKIAALESLWVKLKSNQAKFEESGKIGAYGEMLSRIAAREKELADEFLDQSEEAKAVARYNKLLENCASYQQQENEAYVRIAKLEGRDAIETVAIQNELKALYLRYKPEYAEMAELGTTWGFDEHNWRKYEPDKYRWKQTKVDNELPVGITDEESHDQIAEQSAREMTERIRQSSSFTIEAKAQAQQRQYASDREKAAAAQRAPLAKAKNEAALAAAWHNRANKDGAPIAPAAQRKAGEGWTKWAKAVAVEATFNRVAKDPSGMDVAVNMHATNAIKLFEEAEALFEEGRTLNAGG